MADQLTLRKEQHPPVEKTTETVELISDKIMVRVLSASGQKKSKGGIILPETAKDKEFAQRVEIVYCGKGRRFGNGEFQAMTVKPGDVALAPKGAGHDIEVGDETFKVMHETDLIGILRRVPVAPTEP